jgi:DNA-binding NtrC family response regulator
MATILYVDDEPAIGLILEDTLERAGHTTVGAHNVPQALQALARGGIDLIISDYRMPGLTGLEFLELLQQEGYDVPLIMLTGFATIEHAVSAIKAGAVDYITKPFNLPVVRARIGTHVLHVAEERDLLQLKKIAAANRHAVGDAEDIAFLERRLDRG